MSKKYFTYILTVILVLCLLFPLFSYASSDDIVFDENFDGVYSVYYYYDRWYSSDWSLLKLENGALYNSDIFLSKNNYENYLFEACLKAPKGTLSNSSKSYIAIRQPAGYGFTDTELGLRKTDGDPKNNMSRPGYVGLLFAAVQGEIEVIVHTESSENASGSSNDRCIVSAPGDCIFSLDFVPLEIKDTGDTVSVSVSGNKVCDIILESPQERTVNDWTGECYTKYTVKDSSGNILISGENALVPVHGAVGSVCRNCFVYLDRLTLKSLTGKAEDAIIEGRYFDYSDIYLRKNSDNPNGSYSEKFKVKEPLSGDQIVLIAVIDVIALAICAMVISLVKHKKIRIAVPAVLVLAALAFTVLMLVRGGRTSTKTVINGDFISSPDDIYVLDSKGNTPQVRIYSSDMTATDGLGRTLPTYEEVGPTKDGKYVGMFYTLWSCRANSLKDNTKLLAQNPQNPAYGAVYSFHWFTEPEVGYYTSTDEWVIRRDMVYLNLAGVDYIYMDFTNGGVYEEAFDVLLETCIKMREEGTRTPCIVPWIFADDSCTYSDLSYIFRKYYSQEKYRQLWFYMDGKPLAMIKRVEDSHIVPENESGYLPVLMNDEIADFFTFRFSWVPSESAEGHYPGQPVYRWSWGNPLWMHNYKSDTYAYGWDEKQGKAEQCVIIVGGHCFDPYGRSGSEGTLDKFKEKDTTPYGLYFEEQYEWIMENHPEVEYININGWNEWMAQYNPDYGNNYFVDSYNREYSRDMAPVSGGFNDSYYYQLCSFIRRFKGMEPPVNNYRAVTVDVTGSFDQWKTGVKSYKDYTGDTTHRNSYDTTGTIQYINNTGRNDIIELMVAFDQSNVYFYAQTAEALTPSDGHSWMLLLIDADCDKSTGFEGCDYLINYCVIDNTKTVICKYIDNVWQEIGLCSYRYEGNELMIEVPRSYIGQTEGKISFTFHWLDNVTDVYSLDDWFLTGDSAPERRHMYVFEAGCGYDGSGENRQSRTDNLIRYMPAIKTDPTEKGLTCTFYTLTSDYGKQPELNLLEPAKTENVQDISFVKYGTSFALEFNGFIKVDSDGSYSFTVKSDDGCTLYIDGRKIIDISGVHTVQSGSGSLLLSEGYHSIRVEYFENGNGGSCLEFSSDKKIEFFR